MASPTAAASQQPAALFDHVKIAVRERPLSETEKASVQVMLRTDEDKLIAFYPDSKEGLVYNYDYFFPEEATQMDLFHTIGAEMVDLVSQGYSACCIANGPSATGKTHTLFGSDQEPGLIQLATKELFHRFAAQEEDTAYTVRFAYWEMNADTICDALSDAPSASFQLRKSAEYGGSVVAGLNTVDITSWEQFDEWLMQGNIRRIQLSEQRSSRWHGFVRLYIDSIKRASPEQKSCCTMTFVHLKGPDRVGQKGGKGDVLKHGSMINKSSSLLSSAILHAVDFRKRAMKEKANDGPKAIEAIIDKSQSFFMECKFTHILGNALCGRQATFMLSTVSTLDYHETTDTLEALQNAQQLTASLQKHLTLTDYGRTKRELAKAEKALPKAGDGAHNINQAEGHPLTEIEERVAQLRARLGGEATAASSSEGPSKDYIPPQEIPGEVQLWKQSVLKAKMHGDRATVYIPTTGKDKSGAASKNTYKGQWARGKKEGFGEHKTPKIRYEGHWAAGMRHGEGTLWTRPSEADPWTRVYKGQWREDKKHGRGIQWCANGDVYDGYFEDGKRGAIGKLFLANGDRIEGQFRNDHVDGYATLYCKNGDWFEGHWLRGQREGEGVWYYETRQQCYRGEWHNNTPKFGTIEDMPKKSTSQPSTFLPRVGLADPEAVILKQRDILNEKRQREFTDEELAWALGSGQEDGEQGGDGMDDQREEYDEVDEEQVDW